MAFPSNNLIIGSQSGTLFQYIYPSLTPVRSFNHNQNFFTTAISAMSPSMIVSGTSDGFIQIFSLLPGSEGPLYSFQSINKAVRSVLWDLGTRAILYANENEKYQVSFVNAQPSNDGYGKECSNDVEGVIARRIVQTDAFVEQIVQPPGANWTGFLDRNGWVSGVNSPEMRRFLHRTKDTLNIDKRFRLRERQGDIYVDVLGSKEKPEPVTPPVEGISSDPKTTFDVGSIPCCDSLFFDRDSGPLVLVFVANRAGGVALEGWECLGS